MGPVKEMVNQFWNVTRSWLTTPVLFVLLNIVIGSIAVTSAKSKRNNPTAPSMLTRLMSSNFSRKTVYEDDLIEENDIVNAEIQENEQKIEDFTEEEEEEKNSAEEEQKAQPVWIEPPTSTVVPQRTHHSHRLTKSKSDTPPTGGQLPPPLPTRLKKSGTFDSDFSHFVAERVEEDYTRASDPRFATEVDAKAEDFIQKFKRQLKMQRIESFKRYREMIDRAK
eukprot:Gb_15157 [translate_table: standard]